ncbi:hypothetical protein [Streptomyces sp. NPDC086766]|uniref:hypothetical protein n=1 Tax=Streptomyces sp. NPDC086766 TaxID=3365754 RepID=UPI0037FBD0D6
MDQLGGSISWLNKNNPQVKPLPLMVHPSRVCDAKATPQAGKRVVTPARYELSKQAVVQHAVALASDLGRWGDEQAVAAQLAHHKRTSDRFLDTYSEVARTSA